MKEIAKQISSIFPEGLFSEICGLIEKSKNTIAVRINAEITILYWHIGHRINTDFLDNKRGSYGKQIVSQLATILSEKYGKEFEIRNLRRMMQFAKQFNDFSIVSQVATQLSWSHFIELLPLKDALKREFYLTLSVHEGWGRDILRGRTYGYKWQTR